jgi:hypothetical protein
MHLLFAQDAVVAFEGAMDVQPNAHAAYNLVILSYAAGDPEGMSASFQSMVQVRADMSSHAHLRSCVT